MEKKCICFLCCQLPFVHNNWSEKWSAFSGGGSGGDVIWYGYGGFGGCW